ncbi:MAG: sensor histidine kinase [Blautia sp.]|jgi:signal transduction histidine kinase
MKSTTKNLIKTIAAWSVLSILIIGIVVLFFAISHTQKSEIYLMETSLQKTGWSYYASNGTEEWPTAPEYTSEYDFHFPRQEEIRALRITRTMTEALPDCHLSISPYGAGIDLFLDDELLYSDFSWEPRSSRTYLTLSAKERERFLDIDRSLCLSLPMEYTGQTLTVIYYYPDSFSYTPLTTYMYPILQNLFTQSAIPCVDGASSAIAITLYSVMLFVLIAIFGFGLPKGQYQWNLLLLAAYFLCLILHMLSISTLGTVCLLPVDIYSDYLNYLCIIPLLLFIGITFFSGRPKKAAVIFTLLLSAADLTCFLLDRAQGTAYTSKFNPWLELLVFLIFVALGVIERRNNPEFLKKQILWKSARSAMAVLLLTSLLDSMSEESFGIYWANLFYSLAYLNAMPLMQLISQWCAIFVTFCLLQKFIRDVAETRKNAAIYQLRSQMAMETCRQLRDSTRQIREVKHELRHHAFTLLGLLQKKEYDRAKAYTAEMTADIQSLPQVSYCENLLVNTIASAYAQRMSSAGITCSYELNLPEVLPFADTDLSVLLTNILENAVEACGRLSQSAHPQVMLHLAFYGNMLVLTSENSCPPPKARNNSLFPTSKSNTEAHGFGMGMIRSIVKKYDGEIEVMYTENKYQIKLYLNGKSS